MFERPTARRLEAVGPKFCDASSDCGRANNHYCVSCDACIAKAQARADGSTTKQDGTPGSAERRGLVHATGQAATAEHLSCGPCFDQERLTRKGFCQSLLYCDRARDAVEGEGYCESVTNVVGCAAHADCNAYALSADENANSIHRYFRDTGEEYCFDCAKCLAYKNTNDASHSCGLCGRTLK